MSTISTATSNLSQWNLTSLPVTSDTEKSETEPKILNIWEKVELGIGERLSSINVDLLNNGKISRCKIILKAPFDKFDEIYKQLDAYLKTSLKANKFFAIDGYKAEDFLEFTQRLKFYPYVKLEIDAVPKPKIFTGERQELLYQLYLGWDEFTIQNDWKFVIGKKMVTLTLADSSERTYVITINAPQEEYEKTKVQVLNYLLDICYCDSVINDYRERNFINSINSSYCKVVSLSHIQLKMGWNETEILKIKCGSKTVKLALKDGTERIYKIQIIRDADQYATTKKNAINQLAQIQLYDSSVRRLGEIAFLKFISMPKIGNILTGSGVTFEKVTDISKSSEQDEKAVYLTFDEPFRIIAPPKFKVQIDPVPILDLRLLHPLYRYNPINLQLRNAKRRAKKDAALMDKGVVPE